MIARPQLESLCRLAGIALEYTDIWGGRHPTSDATAQALLAAQGIAAATPADIERSLQALMSRTSRTLLPPVYVHQGEEDACRIPVSVPTELTGARFAWRLVLENGEREGGSLTPADLEPLDDPAAGDDGAFKRFRFELPTLPKLGYHRFSLRAHGRGITGTTTLIVAPRACYTPAAASGEARLWGPSVQLYALRSQRNWGIGDFSDLGTLLEFAAAQGAGIVGLSPLHALFPHNPEHASPYAPSSRLYLNLLYLDVEAIADFAESESIAAFTQEPRVQAQLRALRADAQVDYAQVAALKLDLLKRLFEHFRQHHLDPLTKRGKVFRQFQEEEGASLRCFAAFEALQAFFHHKDASVWGWPRWPSPYRNAASRRVENFVSTHGAEVEFYQYVQWQAALQLQSAHARARRLGLGLGICNDLAVSVDRGGAETWANRAHYALDASIGAPPDDFNLSGQNWGLPPWNPRALFESAYAAFIALLRKNMQGAGALRIDHVMWLFRLFWIPAGSPPTEGAYVAYPADDLLSIVALESHRNRCLIIGEDLGTVPEDVRQTLNSRGIFSYRILYFERDANGRLAPPAAYAANALGAIGTHDMPTLPGYWIGRDIDLRNALHLFPSETLWAGQVAARAEERANLLLGLQRENLLPEGLTVHPNSVPAMTTELALAAHAYLARSPCRLTVFRPEDMLGQIEAVNVPGTSENYPNWRYKLSLNMEEWPNDPRITGLAEILRQERGSGIQSGVPSPQGAGMQARSARIPSSTYRLQFNRAFTFKQATTLVPYLHDLGISHCYASPFLKARAGSSHGYDIIDHNSLNPEIGSADDFARLVDALHYHRMGLILDMVPNHMGVMNDDNSWWLDVLENGQASAYAQFFDIDWTSPKEELRGKVLLPVLGDHYGDVLERGDLKLAFDASRGEFSVHHPPHRFPIDPAQYPAIIGRKLETLAARVGEDDPHLRELQTLLTAFGHLPGTFEASPARMAERSRDKEIHKQHLAKLHAGSPDVAWLIQESVHAMNGDVGMPTSFDELHALLQSQPYRLAYWRVAADEINYRRFFDINDLASLRMENEAVFEATHGLVFKLIGEGAVDGLRIDHPDGLYDPAQYFQRLQAKVGALRTLPTTAGEGGTPPVEKGLYVVVEKILASHEQLRQDWQVHGTTGYDFCNLCTGLFVNAAAQGKMTRTYAHFTNEAIDPEALAYASKRLIMGSALTGELNVLANRLARIAMADRHTSDFTANGLRRALAEVIASFPVYRTYVSSQSVSSDDRRELSLAVDAAKRRVQAADPSIFDFVREALLTELAEGKTDAYREMVVDLAMKAQQYMSPVMAKGMEDTAFYRYHRLASLNEVGGDLRRFGVSISAFHRASQERAKQWPHALLATSTHDSKRSEDVRARINVLSELPNEWRVHVTRWAKINQTARDEASDPVPLSRHDEYLLYQSLLGIWPLAEVDDGVLEDLRERMEQYMLKASREAKTHTSWVHRNPRYEDALQAFVRKLLGTTQANPFLASFVPFQRRVAHFGMLSSLSQALLKLTSPGVPDIYQGNEVWEFSLVDPDNRRPVDYGARRTMLREVKRFMAPQLGKLAARAQGLLEQMEDGRIKLYMTWKLLNFRQAHPSLFGDGGYSPLETGGARKQHLCAYARAHENELALCVAPRWFALLAGNGTQLPLGPVWGDTWLDVTAFAPPRWLNVLTGEVHAPRVQGSTRILEAKAIFRHLPYAVLVPGKSSPPS